MTNIRHHIEYLVTLLIMFFKTLFEWLPYISIFIFLGAVIYGLLSHWVGYILMLVVPLGFCLLKAWADMDK